MACSEFSIIARYFDRVKDKRIDVETGIGDDCALLNVIEKQTLAISTDTLVCGIHFLPNIDPSDLAYKAVAVNISDLAAVGAAPAWLTLALTMPECNESWLDAFSESLFEQLNYYDMQLIGGDTTSGPLSITLTIHGYVPAGRAIKRSGAKPGDLIYVTGTLGDSAAGLAILQNKLYVNNIEDAGYMVKHHLRPIPRVRHGQVLLDFASAAIDLSDGLISDLKKILKASSCGARVEINNLPISQAMSRHLENEQALLWAMSGGEDYELCFTIPPEINLDSFDLALRKLGVKVTCIGKIVSEIEGLQCIQDGALVTLTLQEFDHFA